MAAAASSRSSPAPAARAIAHGPGHAQGGRAPDGQVADGGAQLVDGGRLEHDQLAGQPALVDHPDPAVVPLDRGRDGVVDGVTADRRAR